MSLGSRRLFCLAATSAVVSLAAVAAAGGQAAPQAAPVTSDTAFKNVMMLKGIPVDTFFEAMGMFASAMGNDCTFCHSPDAYFDKSAFATPTPRINRAREMIAMTNALNKQYFGGRPRVTCFTCHGGSNNPRHEPDLTIQYGEGTLDANARDFATYAGLTSDQVFDRHIQAIGGQERVGRLKSFVAKGSYSGFDTAVTAVPVEIYAAAPNQRSMVVHLASGASVRTYNGSGGWMAGPDTPVPLVTLSGGNLDRARLESIVSFPAGLRQAFKQWRVGRTLIDDNEVIVVQGSDGGAALANVYFDQDGLLLRLVRWTDTPVGLVPTQVDYSDYREIAGVKMPFKWMVTQTYMQMTVQLTEVLPNAAIGAERFARPAPAQRRAGN